MDNISIYFQAESHTCTEFILMGKKKTVAVVISPLKAIEAKNAIKLTSGCNMWEHCENANCHYSLAARPPLKIKE